MCSPATYYSNEKEEDSDSEEDRMDDYWDWDTVMFYNEPNWQDNAWVIQEQIMVVKSSLGSSVRREISKESMCMDEVEIKWPFHDE